MKGSSQCDAEPEHNVPGISAKEVKVKGYQSHSEHWGRGECHLSALCYKVRIEIYKECGVIIIWMN